MARLNKLVQKKEISLNHNFGEDFDFERDGTNIYFQRKAN